MGAGPQYAPGYAVGPETRWAQGIKWGVGVRRGQGTWWGRLLIYIYIYIHPIVPSGKSLSPLKFDALKSYVEEVLGPLCSGLKAGYSEKVFSAFFSNSTSCAACETSFSFASD